MKDSASVAAARQMGSYRLTGTWTGVDAVNVFLGHLDARAYSPATVKAYAFDLVNFARFLIERDIEITHVVPTTLFDWIDAQSVYRSSSEKVVSITSANGSAPASVNRRVAAVRAFFEHQVLSGTLPDNPVPSPRRGQGLRPKPHGLLGHLGPGRAREGGRLVRQSKRLPESLDPADVSAFIGDLDTHRDRAIVFAMLFGGLRAGEVRSLRLADVDQGRRWVRVLGKGGKERTVPIDSTFFAELAQYLRIERPAGLSTPECFVVLHGPTLGHAITEDGLRSIFRYHRTRCGANRVRPHRLRHTFGTEMAAAGIDLLVLRELMGHASPVTTASYVHLSDEHLVNEYRKIRRVITR